MLEPQTFKSLVSSLVDGIVGFLLCLVYSVVGLSLCFGYGFAGLCFSSVLCFGGFCRSLIDLVVYGILGLALCGLGSTCCDVLCVCLSSVRYGVDNFLG